MKTPTEILEKYTKETTAWNKEDIVKAMVEYAKIVMNEVVEKYMPVDQRYHSSGSLWCRVCMEDIQEWMYKNNQVM